MRAQKQRLRGSGERSAGTLAAARRKTEAKDGAAKNMHEYPITQQIIKICTKHCEEAKAEKVIRVKLVVGETSGFIGESIQMYFDVISEGTPCEGATLDIVRVKPKLRCPACGELFVRAPMSFACPKCGTDGEPTEIGKEFYIEEIEVE